MMNSTNTISAPPSARTGIGTGNERGAGGGAMAANGAGGGSAREATDGGGSVMPISSTLIGCVESLLIGNDCAGA